MDTTDKYLENIKTDLVRLSVNLAKARGLYYSEEKQISEATDAILKLDSITIDALIKIVKGQVEIIENLKLNGGFLQHELNLQDLLKGL
jgi:phage shock protein A